MAKRRRKLTPEQERARDERRARLRVLCKQIAGMSEQERARLAERAPVLTVEGHALSLHNTCMVAMQRADATVVAGFRQWKRAGRSVRKGEHGIGIWCPKFAGKGEKSPETEPKLEGFIFGTVFDVAQTDETASAATAAT